MVTNQKILDRFTFFETSEDASGTHKNFTRLGRGNHEIPGGGGWYPMWVPKPLVSEELKLLSGKSAKNDS